MSAMVSGGVNDEYFADVSHLKIGHKDTEDYVFENKIRGTGQWRMLRTRFWNLSLLQMTKQKSLRSDAL